jgi:hypothetical protein
MSYQQEIPVTTKGHGDMHDITEQVAAIVISSVTEPVLSTFSTSAAQLPWGQLSSSLACSMICQPS